MTTTDERPGVWVGHVAITVSDVTRTDALYRQLGMRAVHATDDIAILELRGGTHVVVQPGSTEGGDAPFDLMVDDLATTHQRWADAGLDVSDIVSGDIHDVFVLTDADGYRYLIYSSHVIGAV